MFSVELPVLELPVLSVELPVLSVELPVLSVELLVLSVELPVLSVELQSESLLYISSRAANFSSLDIDGFLSADGGGGGSGRSINVTSEIQIVHNIHTFAIVMKNYINMPLR